jgi:hypothetical protein
MAIYGKVWSLAGEKSGGDFFETHRDIVEAKGT